MEHKHKKNLLDKFKSKIMGNSSRTKPAPTPSRRFSLDRMREDFKETAIKENTQAELELRRATAPIGLDQGRDWQAKPLERNIENRGITLSEDTGALRSEVPPKLSVDKPQLYRPAERSQSGPYVPKASSSEGELVSRSIPVVPFIVNATEPGALRVGTPRLSVQLVPPPNTPSTTSSASSVHPLTSILSAPQQQPEITMMRPVVELREEDENSSAGRRSEEEKAAEADVEKSSSRRQSSASSTLANSEVGLPKTTTATTDTYLQPLPNVLSNSGTVLPISSVEKSDAAFSATPQRIVLPTQRIQITPTGASARKLSIPSIATTTVSTTASALSNSNPTSLSNSAVPSRSQSQEWKFPANVLKGNLPAVVPVITETTVERLVSETEPLLKPSDAADTTDCVTCRDGTPEQKKESPTSSLVPPSPSQQLLQSVVLGELKSKLNAIRPQVEARSEIKRASIGGTGIAVDDRLLSPNVVQKSSSSAKDVHDELLHVLRGKRNEEDKLAEVRSSKSDLHRNGSQDSEMVPDQAVDASSLSRAENVLSPAETAVPSLTGEQKSNTMEWRGIAYVYIAIAMCFIYSIFFGMAVCFKAAYGLSVKGAIRARDFVQNRTRKVNNSATAAEISHIKQE